MSSTLWDSVILITSTKPKDSNFGTGFVIHRDGELTYLLTCAHVVKAVGGKDAVKAGDIPAQVIAIGKEESSDLAVLAVPGLSDKPLLSLGVFANQGAAFTTVGFRASAGTKQLRQSSGRLGRRRVDLADGANRIKAWDLDITDGPTFESGCSGSPVVDQITDGVVGVVIHRQDDTGRQGLAISVEALERIWAEMPPGLLRETIPHPPPTGWLKRFRRCLLGDRPLRSTLWISFAVAAFVIGVRHLGGLQWAELPAFDLLMRSRPYDEGQDDRIRIIAIDEDDIKAQPEQERLSKSISHTKLGELLIELERYQPRVIGLDIYRDNPVNVQTTDKKDVQEKKAFLKSLLENDLSDNRSLIAVCKVPDKTNKNGKDPPPEIPKEQLDQRVGFSDNVIDQPDMIRRHLLALTPPGDEVSRCSVQYAFSFQIAYHYLRKEFKIIDGNPSLGGISFPRIPSHIGGYQGVDNSGYQILLNYRNHGHFPQEIAPMNTLRNFMNATGSFKPEEVHDRIVLIGINTTKDIWATPYNSGRREVPGVVIQAHMISQILSAVEGINGPGNQRRLLLWAWTWWGDDFWILGSSLIAGFLIWRFDSSQFAFVVLGASIAALIGVCVLVFFFKSGWLPLIPSVLVMAISGFGVIRYTTFQSRQQ